MLKHIFFTTITLTTALAVSSSSSYAASVFQNNKEWMQLTSTANSSYGTMAANCNTTTGLCSSGINNLGESLEGWTWASNTDVISLFDSFITDGDRANPSFFKDTSNPTAPYNVGARSSDFAPAAIGGGAFLPTYEQTQFGGKHRFRSIYGVTRSLIHIEGNDWNSLALIQYDENLVHSSIGASLMYLNASDVSRGHNTIGAWLYKDVPVSAVPLPAAAFMFAPALLGFLGLRRKIST